MASGLESIVNGKLRSLGGRVPCASVEVLRFAQDDRFFRVVGFSNHSLESVKLRSLGGRLAGASVEVLRFAQDDWFFVSSVLQITLLVRQLRRICRFVGKRCACSHVHRQECLCYLVDRGGDDDADADRHRAYQDR